MPQRLQNPDVQGTIGFFNVQAIHTPNAIMFSGQRRHGIFEKRTEIAGARGGYPQNRQYYSKGFYCRDLTQIPKEVKLLE